jgi:hypothetical protein
LSPEAAERDVLRPFHVAAAAKSRIVPHKRWTIFSPEYSPVDAAPPPMEPIEPESVALGSKGDRMMWTRWICAAAICLAFAPQANASGILHRASCTVVRFYVAKYSASAAETWARSKGATDAEIEAARHCLKDSPVQTATVLSSAPH